MFPKIDPSCYVDPSAVIIGNVVIQAGCSVWPNAVIRADLNRITIGEGSNIQDNCTLHCTADVETIIGKNVSIGHGAVIHGAIIGDGAIIGMNATVLDGSVIGSGCLIGANALVTAGSVVPENSLVLGVPGKIVKQDPDLLAKARNAQTYHGLRDAHRSGAHTDWKEFYFTIIPADRLREHEAVRPDAAIELAGRIANDGSLLQPLLVDRKHHVILDGHHRFRALLQIGVSLVPVYLVEYMDPRVELDLWEGAEVDSVTKDDVISMGLSDDVYPPKTTRHKVGIDVPDNPTPLSDIE